MPSSPSVLPLDGGNSTAHQKNKKIEKNQYQNMLSLKLYLKVYINMILYHKQVYPANCFSNKLNSEQMFNLSIFLPVIRHPYLEEYIERVIESLVNDVLLVNFTHLLDNDFEEIILYDTDDEILNDSCEISNNIKFVLELVEIVLDPVDDIKKEKVRERFVLDFMNFPIDYYQNANIQNIITCFRENLVSLNTFLQLNSRVNQPEDFLPNGTLRNDRLFKIKVNVPSYFPLNETSQYDWISKKNEELAHYKQKVPLKELEFLENVTIYSSFERY